MITFISYHGTSRTAAESIMKTGFIVNSKVGWLGTGVYFYEDNCDLAISWASKENNLTDIKVLKCIIKIKQGKVFDITVDFRNN